MMHASKGHSATHPATYLLPPRNCDEEVGSIGEELE